MVFACDLRTELVAGTQRQAPSAPTLREVAELAGVSPMTASRTLSGGKNVRADLQRRVLDAVTALGYHRNENARSMRPGHRSDLIGVAITNLANPYYGRFAQGVEKVAAEHGRRVLLGNSGEDLGRETQLISDFLGRRVEGLIVVPTGGGVDHLRPARLGNTPLVLASRAVENLDVDTVLLDDVRGAYAGTKRVLEAGHRRVAFLGNAASVFTARRRFDGFRQALAEFGINPEPELVMQGQQDPAAARRAMQGLLHLTNPPTAVFCSNNRNTIGALEAIGSHRIENPGYRPPTVVGFDDVELAHLMRVPLLIISHNPEELGARAAELLFNRVDDSRPDKSFCLVELPVVIHDLGG